MTETTQAKKLKVSCTIPGGIELQVTREAGSTAFPGARVRVPYGSPVAIPGGASHVLVDAKFMEAWFAQNKRNDALKACLLVEDPDAPAPTDNVEKSEDGAGDETVHDHDGEREKQTGNDGGADRESKDVNVDKSGSLQKLTDAGISTGTEGGAAASAVVVPGDLSKPSDKPESNEGDTDKPADDPVKASDDVQKPQESGTQEPTDKPADDPA